ncbi:CooT family nickel-binding protein [Alkalibaculum sp. M08DMB]|uniref:CooT family nickel-binding protein n=1 Tax=Alkalibaculum sporogenes TaxID=2655001 RepID=A0A6A7KC69_9FIRM|nr:CooT family nickel-binding protein [Alkalibaculum sporogenes]MPW26777.1 CooT family nickel-binding protein [Alkalibaculum sporogenes]
MCEANVYLVDENGEKTLLLEAVDRIIPEGDNVFIENIFGERKTVAARILEMALVDHKVLLSKII